MNGDRTNPGASSSGGAGPTLSYCSPTTSRPPTREASERFGVFVLLAFMLTGPIWRCEGNET
jgi:hypothetical protein